MYQICTTEDEVTTANIGLSPSGKGTASTLTAAFVGSNPTNPVTLEKSSHRLVYR